MLTSESKLVILESDSFRISRVLEQYNVKHIHNTERRSKFFIYRIKNKFYTAIESQNSIYIFYTHSMVHFCLHARYSGL